MPESIGQRELRNDSGRIMRALDDGASFVITSNGRPVGELRPLRRERLVPTHVVRAAFAQVEPIELEALRRDLDAVIDNDIEPRG